MLWILINAFFFMLNLTFALNAESVGWAAFSGFFSGTSIVFMIWAFVDYMDGENKW